MQNPPEIPVAPGSLLAGKYRVERVLGAGGMGVVVAAIHEELHQRVAVKFLHPSALGHGEATERFLREARAAVRIQSENVARVIDVGRLDNEAPYMVMEYLDGQDLAARLREGPISVTEAVGYVVQACAAMVEAHAAGIVHRDLKPANLFLTQRGDGSVVVKVLDFGISKLRVAGASDPSLTSTSAMMGSPFYMSPEQMRSSKSVDHRTDVWALGAILYELLTGRTAFQGETLPEVLASIMTDEPRDLSQLRPDAPPALVELVKRCLNKDPAKRFQTMAELACAFSPFAGPDVKHLIERISRAAGLSTAGVTAAQPAGTVPLQATDTNWSDTQNPLRRRRSGLVVAISVAAFILAGVGWFALGMPGASSAETPETPSLVAAPPPVDRNVSPTTTGAPRQQASTLPRVEPVERQPSPAINSASSPKPAAEQEQPTKASASKKATVRKKPAASQQKTVKPPEQKAKVDHQESPLPKVDSKPKNPLSIDLK